MKFQRSIFLGAAILLFACQNKEDDWLKTYAQTKCAYQTERDKMKADSLDKIAPLASEQESLKKQLVEISEPFRSRLAHLASAVREVENDYIKKIKKAQAVQSEKYGHMSTPAYEKTLSGIESWRSVKIEALQKEIALAQSKMETLPDFISVSAKLKKQDQKIETANNDIIGQHKFILDSLQEILNVENDNFKNLSNELPNREQTLFKQKRDSIRNNPCKL